MTTNTEDGKRIRDAIGALLDDAPEAPLQRPLASSPPPPQRSRWPLAAAAAAIAVLGVGGLVVAATRDTPNTPAPADTVPPDPASTIPVTDPPSAASEFRTETEDFLNDAGIVADAVGGAVSGSSCDEPASTEVGTIYRCVAQVEGLGEYELDVRIEAPDTFEVYDFRAT